MTLQALRARQTAALEDLLATYGRDIQASAELYDPSTGQFTTAGSMPAPIEGLNTATLMPDGRVLVTDQNGNEQGHDLGTASLFDPNTGEFTLTGWMGADANSMVPRTAVLLPDGRVLFAGGTSSSIWQIYSPPRP
jgi:hypothetical protein